MPKKTNFSIHQVGLQTKFAFVYMDDFTLHKKNTPNVSSTSEKKKFNYVNIENLFQNTYLHIQKSMCIWVLNKFTIFATFSNANVIALNEIEITDNEQL